MRSYLREISIIPAWNIAIKKLITFILRKVIKGNLDYSQLGANQKSDCGFAELVINNRAIKNLLRKMLTIDDKETLDSVNQGIHVLYSKEKIR